MRTSRLASPLLFSIAALLALPVACVTVNVNFPEAAVQKATDDYVQELYRAKEKGRATPGSEPTSARPSGTPSASLLDFVLPSAQAADIPTAIRMDSPAINLIKGRQAERLERITAAKKAGQLGEDSMGLLALDPKNTMKPLLKANLQPIADAENADRKQLYAEVLKANGIDSKRLKDLQLKFARSFQADDQVSPAGTWVQGGDGKWVQK